MDWYVGQKVVCVDSDWEIHENSGPVPFSTPDPVKGAIYTIRDIEVKEDWVGLRLEEITNLIFDGYETTYEACGFKPVRTTDISIFTQMLAPSKVNA